MGRNNCGKGKGGEGGRMLFGGRGRLMGGGITEQDPGKEGEGSVGGRSYEPCDGIVCVYPLT